jgi:hypothetical protein
MSEVALENLPHEEILDHGPPTSRMSHTAGIYGGCLVVHGGYSGQEDNVLDDIALFDISIGKWIIAKQPKNNKKDAYISARYNHTMTVVQDPHIPSEYKNRMMWIIDPYKLVSGGPIDET